MISIEEELHIQHPQYGSFIKQAAEEVAKKNKGDTLLQKPQFNLDLSAFLLIYNLPEVPEAMKPKLEKALVGLLTKCALNGYLVGQPKVSTLGQCLLQFQTDEQVQKAQKQLNGFPFDKSHQLQAFTIKELQNIQATNEYQALNLKPMAELLSFAQDAKKRPQLLVVQDKSKIVCQWLEPLERRLEEYCVGVIPKYEKLQWSPNGAYLVLIHENYFQLYGSEKMELLHQFNHIKVQEVHFSKDEKYIISYDGNVNQDDNFIIWNVREERKLRVFNSAPFDTMSTFQFNSDATFLARKQQDQIVLFSAPDFYQWETPIVAKHVQSIQWLQNTQYLAYTQFPKPFAQNQKQTISIMSIPSRQELKWKTISGEVENIELLPSHSGKWLATVLKKRNRKQISTTLQLGNLTKLITGNMEIDEHTITEDVDTVFYEQHTGRFALCYRDKDKQQKLLQTTTFHLYVASSEDPNKKGLNLIPIGKLAEKEANEVQFASNGNYFAIVNKLKGSPDQGKIEFGCIQKKSDNQAISYNVEITKSTNHFYMSHAQWDPSGIYYVTMSDQWHSVIVWSAIGEQLIKDTITKINDINWRSRASHILNDKEESKLAQNSKAFVKKYEVDDDKVLNKAKYDKEIKRKEMKEKFTQYIQDKLKQYNESKDKRIALLGFDENDTSEYVQIETIEKEEIVV